MAEQEGIQGVVDRLQRAAVRVLGPGVLATEAFASLVRYVGLVTRTRDFTHLPPLLGADRELPIATMYVELSVCRAGTSPSPRLLAPNHTLAQAMEERYRRRTARKLSVAEALGAGRYRTSVVLGDPGSGKTSLLKRLALDIGHGVYPRWTVPLYVPLRVYWEDRRRLAEKGIALDLLRYAAIRAAGAGPKVSDYGTRVTLVPAAVEAGRPRHEAMEALLRALSGDGVLLLLDALDEIATNPEAVAALTADISALGVELSWVVTSRRAGFFGGLGEEARFEVVDLDEDARARVVHNWFTHQQAPGEAAGVLEQVEADARLRSMARSPFLLTLLCYLHHVSAGPLPLVRAGAYAAILRAIRAHMNHARKDERAFTERHVDVLAGFAHWLYTDAPGAPRHLFASDDWDAYALVAAPGAAPPLETPYLASRLLDRWSEHGEYHFVHLTFHEYLAARAIVDRSLGASLHRLHAPAFREVFRFVAGMLRASGRDADLTVLLSTMLRRVDLLGMVYVEVARLLAEVGISDTRPLLGADLRETLWSTWSTDAPYLAEAAGEALALFAPDFVINRVEAVLAGAVPLPRPPRDALAEIWHDMELAGSLRVRAQRGENAVILLLAEVRDARAEDRLLELFCDDRNEARADLAVYALARIASRRVRLEILRRATRSDAGIALKRRAYRYARHAPHEELLPWLVVDLAAAGDDDVGEIFEALGAVGALAAAGAIARWLREHQGAPDGVRGAGLRTLAGVDRPLAEEVLRETFAIGGDRDPGERVLIQAAVGLLDEASVCRVLADPGGDLADAVLDVVADAAEEGAVASDAVLDAVARLCDDTELGERALNALARIEVRRAAAGLAPRRGSILREALASTNDSRASVAAHALGGLGDVGAAAAILAIARDEARAPPVRMTACGAVGRVGRAEPGSAQAMESLVWSEHAGLAAAAADALGQLDVSRLIGLRDVPAALDALSRACAEHGLLVFEDAYVDAGGRLHPLTEDGVASPAAATESAEPPPSARHRDGGPVRVFVAAAPEDASWTSSLERHLRPLEARGDIALWHVGRALPGDDVAAAISERIDWADVVVVILSAHLWESGVWTTSSERVLARTAHDACTIVPVLARPCDWEQTVLGRLVPLPRNGVALARWSNRDQGLTQVAKGLGEVVKGVRRRPPA